MLRFWVYNTGCTHNHFFCCFLDHVRINNVTNKRIVFDKARINRSTLSSSFYLQILLNSLPNSSQSIIPQIDLSSSHIKHIDSLKSYSKECIAIHKRLNRQSPFSYLLSTHQGPRQPQWKWKMLETFAFAIILPSCSNVAALELSVEIHEEINRNGFLYDVVVENSLIDVYSKCGSIWKAHELFNKILQQNGVS